MIHKIYTYISQIYTWICIIYDVHKGVWNLPANGNSFGGFLDRKFLFKSKLGDHCDYLSIYLNLIDCSRFMVN